MAMPLHFVCVTWGAGHTDLFLNAALPTFLAPDNLPAAAERADSVFKLYTTSDDVPRITAHPSYQHLTRVLRTEIVLIKIDAAQSCFATLNDCHKAAILDASANDAAIVFLAPDLVIGDGAIKRLCELADAGKRAVVAASVRVTQETFVPALLGRGRGSSERPMTLSAREMVDLGLDHLHPISTASFWPTRGRWPPYAYWSVGREGIVARCIHLHPFLVVPGRRRLTFKTTVDVDLVDMVCRKTSDMYLVQDSDEMCLFEISPERYGLDFLLPEAMDMAALRQWATWGTNRRQRWRFSQPIRIHRGECSPAWDIVQAKSDLDATHIVDLPRLRQWCEAPVVFPTLRAGLRLARYCRRQLSSGKAAA